MISQSRNDLRASLELKKILFSFWSAVKSLGIEGAIKIRQKLRIKNKEKRENSYLYDHLTDFLINSKVF